MSTKHFSLMKIEEALGAAGLALMVSISFFNVITRYILKFSMAFTEEITLYTFVWITLIGSAMAFREGANVSVSLVYNKFNKKGQTILYIIGTLFTIAFFAILGYWGIKEIMDEISMNATTEAMALPVWWFTIAIPVGSLLTIIDTVHKTYEDLKSSNSGKGAEKC